MSQIQSEREQEQEQEQEQTHSTDGITPYGEFGMDRQLKFARGFDLLPPISWQQGLAPNREVYYFKGHVSEPVGETSRTGDELTTEFTTVRQKPTNRRVTVIEAGSPLPFDRSDATFDSVPLVEMAEDIFSKVRIPDISTLAIGSVHSAPEGLTDHPLLDDVEQVAHAKKARGNRSAAIRKKTGLDTANPYQLAKNDLRDRGVIDDGDASALSKRLKSTLVTNGVLTDTGQTQNDLQTAGVLEDIIRGHKNGNFWEDCGQPVELTMGVNGDTQAGRVYRLEEHGEIVAV